MNPSEVAQGIPIVYQHGFSTPILTDKFLGFELVEQLAQFVAIDSRLESE
jgi:hypothetical protein